MSDLISKKLIQEALIEKISRLNAEGEKSIKTATEFCRFKRYIDGMTPVVASEPSEQVTSKLNNPCDSLLTDDKDGSKEQKSKLDLISRADAIEAVCDVVMSEYDLSPTYGYEIAEKALSALPSADRPHGEWTLKEDLQTYWYECSVCGEKPPRDQFGYENHSSYCPNCGAEMAEMEATK